MFKISDEKTTIENYISNKKENAFFINVNNNKYRNYVAIKLEDDLILKPIENNMTWNFLTFLIYFGSVLVVLSLLLAIGRNDIVGIILLLLFWGAVNVFIKYLKYIERRDILNYMKTGKFKQNLK